MSAPDKTVPLPFVTELPPVTMGSSNGAPELPEIESDKQPLLPPINMSLSVDGQTEHEVKDAASSKYATSGNGVSLGSGDSANNPISPKTPISPRLYNFKRKDENEIQHYIAKAHTCVRQGQPTTSSDKDKDLAKFAEMVSHMTHLLAAAGIGRETTTRALAYMAAPEKPEPKDALHEAKKDRRKKNARRNASGESSKSDHAKSDGQDKANDAKGNGQDKDTAATRKDANNTSESTKYPKSMGDYTTASDDIKPQHQDHVPLVRKTNEALTAPVPEASKENAESADNAVTKASNRANAENATNGRKSAGRRRWWQRRNKGRSSQQTKGQENVVPKESTAEGQHENQASKDDGTKNDGTKSDGIKNDGIKNDSIEEDTKSEGMEAPPAYATGVPAPAA